MDWITPVHLTWCPFWSIVNEAKLRLPRDLRSLSFQMNDIGCYSLSWHNSISDFKALKHLWSASTSYGIFSPWFLEYLGCVIDNDGIDTNSNVFPNNISNIKNTTEQELEAKINGHCFWNRKNSQRTKKIMIRNRQPYLHFIGNVVYGETSAAEEVAGDFLRVRDLFSLILSKAPPFPMGLLDVCQLYCRSKSGKGVRI